MTQFGPQTDGAGRATARVARGMLLALSIPCVAALALDPQSPGGAALRMLAEIGAIPALLAISGWVMAVPIAERPWRSLLRTLWPTALCGGVAALTLCIVSPALGEDWRQALALAKPGLMIVALSVAYAPLACLLRGSLSMRLVLALAGHIAGVIFASPVLTYFIFFVVGYEIAGVEDRLEALASKERELAAASAPFVAVLAAVVSIRFAQTGQAASIAAIGPIALAMGNALPLAVLAGALALRGTPVGDAFGRLGRAAPAIAIFWIPLFLLLMTAANRGLAPTLFGALLMAFSSLLIVAVAADAILDAAERRRTDRLAPQS